MRSPHGSVRSTIRTVGYFHRGSIVELLGGMRVIYLPVLHTLRELYSQPRDMQRFERYIATLTGGTDDVVLPSRRGQSDGARARAAQDRRAAGAGRRRDRRSGRGNGRRSPGAQLWRGRCGDQSSRWCWPTTWRVAGPIVLRPKRWCGFRVAARCDDRLPPRWRGRQSRQRRSSSARKCWRRSIGWPGSSATGCRRRCGRCSTRKGWRACLRAVGLSLHWRRAGERTRMIVTGLGHKPPYPADVRGVVWRRGRRAAGLRAAGVRRASWLRGRAGRCDRSGGSIQDRERRASLKGGDD